MLRKVNLVIAIVISALCLPLVPVKAQAVTDSLNTVLRQGNLSKEDQITTLYLLSRSMIFSNTSGAMDAARKALELAHQVPDYMYTALAYAVLAQVHRQNGGDMQSAGIAVDSAMWYANRTTNNEIKGLAWMRKGWYQNLKGEPHEAVKSLITAQKYLSHGTAYNYQTNVYGILAGIYAEWKDMENHKKYALLTAETAKKTPDIDFRIMGYNVMAVYFRALYREGTTKDRSTLDSVLYYNKRTLKLYARRKAYISNKTMLGIVALNTSDLYQQDFPKQYKDSAIHYLNIAKTIGLETGNYMVAANTYGILSNYAMLEKNYTKAENLLLEGLNVLMKDSTKNNASLPTFMGALSSVAEERGDPRTALKYYREYHRLYGKMFDAEKLAITNNIDAQYQSEKNEAELKDLNEKAALNERLKYAYIALALTAALAALFLMRSLRFKLRASIQLQKLLEKEKEDAALLVQIKIRENEQLEFEKQEAELRTRVKEEEALRLETERQLLQERKEQLQKELAAGNRQAEQKEELLQAVQKKIEESTTNASSLKQINKIIDQNKNTDDADFEDIRPEFFEKLQEKSNNALSRLDIKHCAYISIGLLTNKEIAQRLGVAPKSILMSRYRIKLKLGLTREDDLDEYIGNLAR